MKVRISKKLNDIYRKQHKNFDYAISSILDNLDPDSYVSSFEIVKGFELEGEEVDINIGEDVAKRIIADLEMDSLDNMIVELLLWIGVIFPEV